MIALCAVVASQNKLLDLTNMCSWPMMNKPKIIKKLFPSNRCKVHTRLKYLTSCLSSIYIEVGKSISISIDVCTIEKNHAQIHSHYHALMYKKDYFHRHLHPTTSRNDLAIENIGTRSCISNRGWWCKVL
jgi:hypothetical protein